MNATERLYKKTAKAKAKNYLREKRRYKTKEEKKSFRLAERFRINQWRKGLDELDTVEKAAQLKAFRYYNIRRNMLFVLAGGLVLVLALAAALIVLL